MSMVLVKRAISFSVDQDELGWLELKAHRIGNRRSQVLQDLIRRDAEREEGKDWRAVVRSFTADASESEGAA